jgi:putative nucleotidyltransferase with HDIG domain
MLKLDGETKKLLTLNQVGQDLVTLGDLDMILKKIMAAIKEICASEGSSVLLLDEKNQELYFKEAAGEKGEEVKQIRIPLQESSSIAGWVAIHRQSLMVNEVEHDPRHSKEADKKSGFVTRSILASPVIWQEKVLGVIEAVNKKGRDFSEEDETFLNLLANQVAVALNTARLIGDLRNFFVHSVDLLIQLMDEHSPSQKGHSVRVARIATGMARELKLNQIEYENLFYAAYLHDIGKLKLPIATINDTLHPVLACRMLEPIRMFKDVIPIIRHHHEKFNGTGFPDRLAGKNIPLAARILSVAEDFDEQMALLEARNEKINFYQSFLSGFGSLYDPGLLDAFKKTTSTSFE